MSSQASCQCIQAPKIVSSDKACSLQVGRDLDAEVRVLLYMLENGAPEAIVQVRSGFGGEDVALLRIEAHPPLGCPFLEVLEVGLQGEVILKGADLPIA